MRVRAVVPVALLGVVTSASAARGADFTYMPAGDLVSGSGTGSTDTTVYAPGMRFPIEQAPAYANSQVWGHGGGQGPGGGQCDVENFSYPWWDNYCETRTWEMPLCPAGEGHQGQDIRASTCDAGMHAAVAAVDGTITNIGGYSVYLTAADGTRFDYLHMSDVQVALGDEVTRGQVLGMVANEFGGTPTTVHLHFNIRQNVQGVGTVYVPTYMSLVDSYSELLDPSVVAPMEGALDAAECDAITGWAAIVDDEQAVEAKLYFDGGPGDLDGADAPIIGHPVLADRERPDLCDAIGSCDHGFEVGPPLSLLDGDDHVVRAFGTSVLAGEEPELEGSPKTFACELTLVAGLRRPVDEDARINWRLSTFWDVADVSLLAGGQAELDARGEGSGIDAFPRIVSTDGGDTLWLVDAGYRRRVDADAARAWDFSATLAETWTSAELDALPEGAPLGPRPFVMSDASGALFLIDDPTPSAATPGPSGELPVAADESDAGGCGCAIPGKRSSRGNAASPPAPVWMALAGIVAAFLLRRRSR